MNKNKNPHEYRKEVEDKAEALEMIYLKAVWTDEAGLDINSPDARVQENHLMWIKLILQDKKFSAFQKCEIIAAASTWYWAKSEQSHRNTSPHH